MRDEPEPDTAIAERDEAVAERDFVLKFFTEMGVALGKGRLLRLLPTSDGVEIRSLYPSHADALAAASRIRELRAMVSLSGEGDGAGDDARSRRQFPI
jgi:hypothetical protein